MRFADIPAGSAVFFDANVFVYLAAPHPVLEPVCRALIERVSRGEISGLTSSHVLGLAAACRPLSPIGVTDMSSDELR
jgi:predicted nucleic acid-binding protein